MKINDLPKVHKLVTVLQAQELHCTIIFSLDHKFIEERNHDRSLKIYKPISIKTESRNTLVSFIDSLKIHFSFLYCFDRYLWFQI